MARLLVDLALGAAHAAALGIGRMPEPLLRRLAGAPHVVDGQSLYPEVRIARRLGALRPLPDAGVDATRDRVRRQARLLGSRPAVDRVEDLTIPGPRERLSLRVYQADPDVPPEGVLVWYHGGGWVVGGLSTADPVCRFLALSSNLVVVSVGYGLAPEHPFPEGIDDALAAFRWVRANSRRWRPALDRLPVAVGGDSAGGNAAAVVANLARDDDGPTGARTGGPDFQLMLYPATDATTRYPSSRMFDGYGLPARRVDWYLGRYLSDPGQAKDPRVSPMLTEDLTGVAPAHVVVAGFDVLRDEGLAYAERLRRAGVPTSVQVVSGHVHAFANATGASRNARRHLARAARVTEAALARRVSGVRHPA
ncbi:alpha/beta hydrolase [Myceligenerans salitolerans]|uniref:Alpha/beta hydrolase n=1 Tax=Myceligenerans salitolerans TaxID=1230528 RepID=A0ABS3I4Y0_9MICO|nr:alpha/beta hydrolase [Myceligenerans salitolerans]MBO0608065.1 alpha/beta hydrolase [Myceligenerans salitolerans]